ncbi:RagB/SusD family nutrient uptake outer membrane protein [Polaribacter cellanae]|uniref:RagB/SusD family nutrient uptake outer membrane protein n=1 Tax=Polaribacter cellanae TaxID=2818493 RepID=A0A975CUF2_9FLAO|nr:RagB/SusD family nutrient uptake outer membrane protein [Polaribacter cellanae]QTE23681.1 RagB/SusD family nutrient uptake outer membrane protein [Polaribacter cellanae]
MKNIKIILILLVVGYVTSCSDVLDQPPLHAPDESSFWSSEGDAQKALNVLYTYLPNARRWWAECLSDNSIMTNAWGEGGMGQISQGDLTPSTGYLTAGAHREYNYNQIRNILYFLENIDKLEASTNLENMKGQAYFLLAFRYFRMSRFWGDIILFKKTATLDESKKATRTPSKNVFAFILENLNQAIPLLDDVHDKSGIITQDAAIMLKTEVLMWMASLDDFRDTKISDKSSTELWAEAASTIGTLIDKKRYSLHPDLVTLFQSSTNNIDDETILARQYVEDEITNFINILGLPGGTGLRGGGWASFSAPRNLIDDYQVDDGKGIKESPNYDIVEPFKNRDKRLTSWFLLPGVDVLRQDGTMTPFDSHPDNNKTEALGGEGGGGRSGYWCTKYVELEATATFGYQNWILYRYADALLLYAESLNESDPGNAKIAKAMNQIRTRAGLPGVDALLGDQDAMRQAIRHERRVELVNEEKRLWDIMRWKIAHIVLNPPGGFVYGINKNIDDYNNRQGDWTVEKFIAEPNKFEDHFYFWPIPQSVIDKNANITQNPGY